MRNNILFLSILTILFTLSACGNDNDDDDNDGSQNETTKSLFSRWISQTPAPNNLNALDFTPYTFGEQGEFFVSSSAGTPLCRCSILFTGDESSGQIALSSCTTSPVDCSAINNNGNPYTYTKGNNELEICSEPSSCTIYE